MADTSDIYHDGRILKEAKSLERNGYKIKIFGFHNISSSKAIYNFKIKTLLIVSRKYRILRNINIILNILLINFKILFNRAKFYHSHNTMFLPGMYIASKIYNGKFIYDSHEVQWEASSTARRLENWFIHKADKIINVSEGRANEQAKRFNLNKEDITIISNYPEIPESLNNISKTKNNGKLRFIYSGGFNLGTNKLDNFLDAIKSFDNCEFILMAFGYGVSHQKIIDQIHKNKQEKQVRFIPLVKPNEVINAIEEYDIAVNMIYNWNDSISLKYHGINKMYEYLMAGLPILCSDLASFVSDFENHGVGKAVNPVDQESIKEGIEYFIKHKEHIFEMKQKARDLALKEFNWNTQDQKLIDLYNNLQNK